MTISKGSQSNGYVGYYADNVINAPNGSTEGDFVFKVVDGVNILCKYLGNITDIVLPDDYKGENYEIGKETFCDCSGLTNVTIPNSVTSIGTSAFSGCSGLTSVTIGNSVTSIGYQAFYGCSSLTSVTIPNSVTSIEGYAFSGCNSIEKLELDCETIGAWFNDNSSIKEIVLGDNVKSIGGFAFYYCTGLTSIVIPNSVTSIGSSAFYNCRGLTSVVIPNSVTSIGSSAFAFTGWWNKQPDGLVYKDGWLLGGKGSSPRGYIVIKDGTKAIGNDVFSHCSGLTSITIPNSVTSIGEAAFYNCSGLKEVHITDLYAWRNISFDGYYAYPLNNSKAKLYLNGVEVK